MSYWPKSTSNSLNFKILTNNQNPKCVRTLTNYPINLKILFQARSWIVDFCQIFLNFQIFKHEKTHEYLSDHHENRVTISAGHKYH